MGSLGYIPRAANNTFYVPGGKNASFNCGHAEVSLTEAQAGGYEVGSISRDSGALSPAGIQLMIRQFLNF